MYSSKIKVEDEIPEVEEAIRKCQKICKYIYDIEQTLIPYIARPEIKKLARDSKPRAPKPKKRVAFSIDKLVNNGITRNNDSSARPSKGR